MRLNFLPRREFLSAPAVEVEVNVISLVIIQKDALLQLALIITKYIPSISQKRILFLLAMSPHHLVIAHLITLVHDVAEWIVDLVFVGVLLLIISSKKVHGLKKCQKNTRYTYFFAR